MWQYVIGSICTYLSSTLNATTFSFFIHSPVWPDVRIKVAQIILTMTEKETQQFYLKVMFFTVA